MGKIKNWTKISDGHWKNENSGARLKLEKNWLIKGEEMNGYRIVRSDSGSRVGYGDTKEAARKNAVRWMKKHPMEHSGKYGVGDKIEYPDGSYDKIVDTAKRNGETVFEIASYNPAGGFETKERLYEEDLDYARNNSGGNLVRA